MEPPKLGQLVTSTVGRDAVHVAIAPVRAAYTLQPGQKVFVRATDEGWVAVGIGEPGEKPAGVVDPFLDEPVHRGAIFYLCLYPGTVTTLRHVWTSKAFPPLGGVKVPRS